MMYVYLSSICPSISNHLSICLSMACFGLEGLALLISVHVYVHTHTYVYLSSPCLSTWLHIVCTYIYIYVCIDVWVPKGYATLFKKFLPWLIYQPLVGASCKGWPCNQSVCSTRPCQGMIMMHGGVVGFRASPTDPTPNTAPSRQPKGLGCHRN